jgi:hypothetical protein
MVPPTYLLPRFFAHVNKLPIGAENDAIFRPKELQATATAYAGQAVIFPEMAHDMMLEQDWRKVADYMLMWLEKQGL